VILFKREHGIHAISPLFSSLLFLSFSLLFLLLFREWIGHQELAVSWIPFRRQVGLVLVWHQDGALECLHERYVDVVLVFLVTKILRSCKVVPDRQDFLHLRLSGTVQGIL